MHVGSIIHRLRKERKMTLNELSTRSGVALATLSRMENGKMTGTLESHIDICKALEVALPDLYRELDRADKKVDVTTKRSSPEVFVHNRHATSEMLASKVLNKKMLPVMIKIARGGQTHKEETKVGIEKFIYILEGKLDAVIGGQVYNLTKSDTLYFESSLPHLFKNTGPVEVRMICVTCPPAL